MPFATRMIPTGGAFNPERVEAAAYFDGSADYQSRSFSAGDRKTYTVSVCAQIMDFAAAYGTLFSAGASDYIAVHGASGVGNAFLRWQALGSGILETTRLLRDTQYYWFVFTVDTTQATSSERLRLYINGDRVTDFRTETYPSLNEEGDINSATTHYIGTYSPTNGMFNGNMAQLCFFDGVALEPSDLSAPVTIGTNGERWPAPADADMVALANTHGGNSFALTSAIGDGTDASTNGNNFTPTSMSHAANGHGNTPSLTYPVMSELYYGSRSTGSIIEGGKGYSISAGNSSDSFVPAIGLPMYATEEYYWEVDFSTLYLGYDGGAGITDFKNFSLKKSSNPYSSGTFSNTQYYKINRIDENGSSGVVTGLTQLSTGTRIGIYYDGPSGEVSFYLADALLTTRTILGDGPHFPVFIAGGGNTEGRMYFEESEWTYAAKGNAVALNSANIPAPSEHGADWFNALAYEGDGTAIGSGGQAVTGAGFQPNLAWIKNRDAADENVVYDVLRGAHENLHTDGAAVEATDTEGLDSFDSDGVTLGSDHLVNASAESYIAWLFKAGGAGASNTDGTITTTVSAAATGHFSIGTYTGTGSGTPTIGHGLPGTPDLSIVKSRDVLRHWTVYAPEVMTSGQALNLSLTSAVFSPGAGSVTSLDASTATLSGDNVNAAEDYLALFFRSVPGVCKVGSYEGNGSADGPFIDFGFTPRWIMVKRADGTGDWIIYDTARTPENEVDDQLLANTAGAETTGSEEIDFLSTGFKVRAADAYINANSGDYIYIAMADIGYGQELPPPLGR